MLKPQPNQKEEEYIWIFKSLLWVFRLYDRVQLKRGVHTCYTKEFSGHAWDGDEHVKQSSYRWKVICMPNVYMWNLLLLEWMQWVTFFLSTCTSSLNLIYTAAEVSGITAGDTHGCHGVKAQLWLFAKRQLNR